MNLPGKGSVVNLPRKGVRIYFLASLGQVLVFRVIYQHRANDVASFARELLPRTFGFAMGSAAVFVPQVEVFEFLDPLLFKALGFLFPHFLGVRVCRFLDFLVPDVRTLPFVFAFISQGDGEAGGALDDFQIGRPAGGWSIWMALYFSFRATARPVKCSPICLRFRRGYSGRVWILAPMQ